MIVAFIDFIIFFSKNGEFLSNFSKKKKFDKFDKSDKHFFTALV
jgi:hypothetical protein